MAKKLFYIVAGEASGDRHAAELLKELRKSYPDALFCGVGGRHLKAAGQEQLFDMAQHAVVGLTDVLLHYWKFRGFFRKILDDLKQLGPDALILVDFPGFNLRLAEAVRRQMPETKQIYYISPQVWAWKAGRARRMQEILDLLLVIFPFEKDWFQKHVPDLKTVWVGHPVMDRWRVVKSAGANPDGRRKVVLMPGSREREIKIHLPILLRTALKLAQVVGDLKFLILATDAETRGLMERIIDSTSARGLNVEIQCGYQLTQLSRSDLALVASGTATLECALAGIPMIVVYKTHPLTYSVGRRLVKLDAISIVNLIAERKVVPEFLQDRADPEILAEAGRQLLSRPELAARMKEDLKLVVAKLGGPGANQRAVQEIEKIIPPT
ncbi:MAG: lipid-A-disaccharide synthase [Methylacidiphilales bacterium]|nr:lipid-A-disaccharide synthase [Candidatus Methylacidiphilales bacterium]